MTNNMKRFAAFVMCLAMVLSCVSAMAEGTSMAITGGFGGFDVSVGEIEQPWLEPTGVLLEEEADLVFNVGYPKKLSVYGFSYTDVTGIYDSRAKVTVTDKEYIEVPNVVLGGNQVYLINFTVTANDLFEGNIYGSNALKYENGSASPISINWKMKVIADTNINPKGPVLRSGSSIHVQRGVAKTFSLYGFDYTNVYAFFDGRPQVTVNSVEYIPVPGAYIDGHVVYLINFNITANALYDDYAYPNNVIHYDNGVATSAYSIPNWPMKVTDEAPADDVVQKTQQQEIDLSNVRLVVTSNITGKKVKPGTQMVLTAEIQGGDGLEFNIYWQESTDGGNTWTNIEGATGTTFTEVITRKNAKTLWRAAADLVVPDDAE